MLNHLTLGSDRDALAGDLLEEFGLRRSVGWYWRQVLMAILVGFSTELGRQWRAAVFALAWTVALVTAVPVLYHNTQFHLVFRWALSHDWPESGILTMSVEIFPQFLMWWFGLGLYLLLMRSFTARRFARGVLINVLLGFLAFASDLTVWPIVLRVSMQRGLPLPFIYWTPYFLALLLTLCATLPSTGMKRAVRVQFSS